MNDQQHPQSAPQIRDTAGQYQPTPEQVFVNGKGLMPASEAAAHDVSDELVQRVLDDPASTFLASLMRLRTIILGLRTDGLEEWPKSAFAIQDPIIDELYSLPDELMEHLLKCNVRLETLERARVPLDIIEDAHWVFDQHEDRHAFACAKYALIAAHDSLLALAEEV